MADHVKNLVRFATELVKYYAEKALGEGASAVLVKELTDLAGENVTEKITNFLNQNERAQKLLEAFKAADFCFIQKVEDETLKQLIISQPFAALPTLENLAGNLNTTLDDANLFKAIRNQFEIDWPQQLTDQQLSIATRTYVDCLDRALATKFEQLLQTLYRKVDRVENTSRGIKADTEQILEKQDRIDAKLEKITVWADRRKEVADYREYLAHIIVELKEWEVRYTPMFAQFERLSLFAKVRSPHKEPEELLELVKRSSNLVILGPAGSGKTTTLQKVALESGQKAFHGDIQASIPILIPLRDYGSEGIKRLIEAIIKPWGLTFEVIESDLVSGKFFLIFDGINEIPTNQREEALRDIRRFIKEYTKNRFLFTSRALEYKDSWLSSGNNEFIVCEIQPLGRMQIRDCILRYFDDRRNLATQLIEQLQLHENDAWENRKSLLRLAGFPLLLQMLILTFEDQKRIPRNEGELLLRFVDEILFKREPGKTVSSINPEIKKKLLVSVAWTMYEHQNVVSISKRHAYSVFLRRLDELKANGEAAQDYNGFEVWQEIQNNHLLIERDEVVYWPHPLYQELFVGLSLRDACFTDLWEPRYQEIEVRFRPIDVKWYDNLDFQTGVTMLEVVPHQYRIRALVAVACVNPPLSKEAYLKMEPEFTPGLMNDYINGLAREATSSEINGHYHRNLIDTLGLLRIDSICTPLMDIGIACPSWEGREQVVIEIWMNCKNTFTQETIEYVKSIAQSDPNHRVRKTALIYLIELAKRSKSNDLILFFVDRLLEESFSFVNDSQLNFRSVIGNSIAENKLLTIAQAISENIDNRCRALWALGVSGTRDNNIQSHIIKLAKTDNRPEVRKSAVEALKRFSSKATVNALHFVVRKEEKASIREEAVYCLQACSEYNTIPALLQALADPEVTVGNAAVTAVVEIYRKRNLLGNLIKEANSHNVTSRNRALVALSQIALLADGEKSDLAAKELSVHSREADKYTLLEIAVGLRSYDIQLSNEILRRLLYDKDPEIKKITYQKLSELGEI